MKKDIKEKSPPIRYSSRGKRIPKLEKFDELIKSNNIQVSEGEIPIVLLTKENADIIGGLIETDDNYFPFSRIIFDYFGADNVKKDTERALFAVIREIDKDNNTNAWRYEKNRDSFYRLIDYVMDSETKFFEELEKGEKELPDKLVLRAGSAVTSLSSKVCKYLSEFMYGKDDYYINDSYVRAMLLFYLDFYGVEHKELRSIDRVNGLSYVELYEWLEKLHNARNDKYADTITKSQLDHIMWYCYKDYSL